MSSRQQDVCQTFLFLLQCWGVCSVLLWHQQLQAKEQEIEEWGRRFQEMKSSHQQLRLKLDSVERYLADLPTVEESTYNAQEVSFVEKT